MTLFTSSSLANLYRQNAFAIFDKCFQVKAGHIGGSLSLSQFLLPILLHSISHEYIAYTKLILSKGHASLGLYSLLKVLDITHIPYDNYCSLAPDSYHGHTCKTAHKLIAHSTGSLGHGLPFSLGLAKANYLQGSREHLICVLGDGELQEGTFFETLLHLLDNKHLNLTIIIDDNSSIDSSTVNACSLLSSLVPFLQTYDCSSFGELVELSYSSFNPGLNFIRCITNKYFGLPESFHDPKWHASVPTFDELQFMKSNFTSAFKS